MNVLSLFDGMSCGRIALNRLGINVDNYFSSEINKNAIKIANKNHPQDEPNRLGNVIDVDGTKLPQIDLLIGGSPCTQFSFAGTRKGMVTKDSIEVLTLDHYLELKENNFEFDGQSYLFWEFVRLLNETKPKYFLLENVKMTKNWETIINDELGIEPIMIDSNLISAQNRKRLYWTNIPSITQPEDKKIFIKDILDEEPLALFSDVRIENSKVKTKNYIKWDMSGKGYYSQQDRAYFKEGKMCCVPKSQVKSKVNVIESDGVYRRLSPIEVERLQTVDDNYTEGVADTHRYEMLGNGWTVDVIKHIFKNMEL